MYALSIHRLRPQALLAGALALALGFGVQAQAQQQAAASAAAKGTNRSIIFVGGRKQEESSATRARAHPPSPCSSANQTHPSASDNCSLNPQPIPPGRSLQGEADTPNALASPTVIEPEAPDVDTAAGDVSP